MQTTVGTTAVNIPSSGRERTIIQNLGPGSVEFNTEGSFAYGEGVRISANVAYEFPTPSADDDLWVVASEDSDVRIVRIG
jgi:hypothetical protein